MVMKRRPRVAGLARVVAVRRVEPDVPGGDHLPERPQSFDAVLRPVAGDDRAVDAADRYACDPVRLQLRLVQCLVHAGLVGAERTAALQDQCQPLPLLGPLDRYPARGASSPNRHPCSSPAGPVTAYAFFPRRGALSRKFHSRPVPVTRTMVHAATAHSGIQCMTRDEILSASAMPLTSPSYPKGPYRFIGREYLLIHYEFGSRGHSRGPAGAAGARRQPRDLRMDEDAG